jgi:hypothetical protein
MRKFLALGVLAACGGGGGGGSTDIKPTMTIADHTDAEISMLLTAAGGQAMFSAQAQVESFNPPNTDPCPAASISGDTVTITGGCTTQSGVAIAGTATIENPQAWDPIQYNYSKATVYSYMQFELTQSGYTTTYDGFMKMSGTAYDSDITTTSTVPGSEEIRADLYYSCNLGSKTCALSGSGLELAGDGVLASGTVATQAQTAKYTLRGTDTLDATITSGCVSWKIEGTTRMSATTCP